MADLSQTLVGFLDALGRNPAYLFLFIAFIILLILVIVVRHIRSIRNEEIFVHQAWGANWKGRR